MQVLCHPSGHSEVSVGGSALCVSVSQVPLTASEIGITKKHIGLASCLPHVSVSRAVHGEAQITMISIHIVFTSAPQGTGGG